MEQQQLHGELSGGAHDQQFLAHERVGGLDGDADGDEFYRHDGSEHQRYGCYDVLGHLGHSTQSDRAERGDERTDHSDEHGRDNHQRKQSHGELKDERGGDLLFSKVFKEKADSLSLRSSERHAREVFQQAVKGPKSGFATTSGIKKEGQSASHAGIAWSGRIAGHPTVKGVGP